MVASSLTDAFSGTWRHAGHKTAGAELGSFLREANLTLDARADRERNPQHEAALLEAAKLINRARRERYGLFLLQEAMTSSDFPLLTGDLLQRMLLANYQVAAPNWQAYLRQFLLNDFRQMRLIGVDGARGRFQAFKKPELTDVQEKNNFAETGYLLSVDLYERGIALDWQAIVNDELGGFESIPSNLSDGARRTESYMAASVFATSSGPDSTFFSDSNKNKVDTTNGATTSNPPLSILGLQNAWTVLRKQTDADGEPIQVTAFALVVPPSLEIIANNIVNGTEIRVNASGGGASDQLLIANNWMQGKVTVVVNEYLPIIDSTSGNTAWYLVADPNVGRPAGGMGFLKGYEVPMILQRAPNTVRVGGGQIDPLMGDFDTHEVDYKGVHILGSTQIDPKMAVASTGAGS